MVPVCVHCKQIFIYIYKKSVGFQLFYFPFVESFIQFSFTYTQANNSTNHIRTKCTQKKFGSSTEGKNIMYKENYSTCRIWFNSLWPSDSIWQKIWIEMLFLFQFLTFYWSQKSYLIHKKHSNPGWTLGQVMACCLTAPRHYSHHC